MILHHGSWGKNHTQSEKEIWSLCFTGTLKSGMIIEKDIVLPE